MPPFSLFLSSYLPFSFLLTPISQAISAILAKKLLQLFFGHLVGDNLCIRLASLLRVQDFCLQLIGVEEK